MITHAIKLYSVLLLVFLSMQSTSFAEDLQLAATFTDHMVLQRGKPVPVWGWADSGEQVTVKFSGQMKSAIVGKNGKWMVKLDPMKADAQPHTLLVSSSGQDQTANVKDVLVGEVWLGSGQSNMAMTVSRSRDFDKEKSAANMPLIRMFKENSSGALQPQENSKGEWTICSSETVGSFSATLYFFGREIHQELGVPVGLINSSVGGTPIESWVAAGSQAQTPELAAKHTEAVSAFEAFNVEKAQAQYEKALTLWKATAAKAKTAGQPIPRKPRNGADRHLQRGGPGGLFNGKIAPLIPYALRGVLWYQGEANTHPGKGHLYQYQLPLLVRDWRKLWGEDFPFAWVQLPNFQRDGEGWMLVREGMLKTLRLPHTGMAITIDIGDPKDIHPKNKQDVGRRLAYWALSEVYEKEKVAASGPLPMNHEIRGNEMIISFTHTEGGLKAKGGKLKGFVISGTDQQWEPGTARIVGDQVFISHPDITKPIAVRYAWEANPDCNLFNGQGLPASPFRTDSGL